MSRERVDPRGELIVNPHKKTVLLRFHRDRHASEDEKNQLASVIMSCILTIRSLVSIRFWDVYALRVVVAEHDDLLPFPSPPAPSPPAPCTPSPGGAVGVIRLDDVVPDVIVRSRRVA